jgi:hypothetical protein
MSRAQGAWQLNVEQVLSNIEAAKQQKQLFVALKAGTAAVADMQREVRCYEVAIDKPVLCSN